MHGPTGDPLLLTPGPLTTAAATKRAMLHDWGSRDAAFIETNARVLRRIVEIANAAESHVCVPMQGSGTFAVEATLGTMIPPNGRALLLVNGAYGRRMAKILDITGRPYRVLETAENAPPDACDVDRILAADGRIGHVVMVHCETTSGIINPVEEISHIVAGHGRGLIIDAMSAFGALELDAARVPFEALITASGKCLEGVPGVGFSLLARAALEKAEGNAHSLSLDLYDQWRTMEKTGQWRFTPPTHVIAALDKALDLFEAEGGQAGRGRRYRRNCHILRHGMREMGFATLLPDDLQAPVIVTFRMPADANFSFRKFYDGLKSRNYVIYPGKLTVADGFRIGCIGHLGESEINGALAAVRQTLNEMGVANGAPA